MPRFRVPGHSRWDQENSGLIEAWASSDTNWGPQKSTGSTFFRNGFQKMSGTIAGKTLLAIVDQGVVSATSFATSVFIGRLCGQEALGIYFLAWSIMILARGIQDNVISAPYMILYPKHQGAALQSYAGSTLVHQLILVATILLAVSILIVFLFLRMGAGVTVSVAVTFWVALPLLMLREHVRRLCLAHLDFTAVLGIDGAVAGIQIGVLCVLSWFQLLTVPAAYGVMALACGITVGGWFFFGHQRFRFSRRRWLPDWRRNWFFGRWALVTFLIGCSAPYMVPWLLTAGYGTGSTGIFAAAMTIVGAGNVVLTGLTNLAIPRAVQALASGGIPRLRQTIHSTLFMIAIPCLVFCGAAAIAGKAVVVLLYGSLYASAAPVVMILFVWLLVKGGGIAAGSALWALERPSANLLSDVLVVVVTLLAVLGMMKSLGPLGAALGMLCGACIGSLARWFTVIYLCRRDKTERTGTHAGTA